MNEIIELLKKCKNVSCVGVYHDPDGRYADMPLFEMREETAEEWNRECKEQRRKYELQENRKQNGII